MKKTKKHLGKLNLSKKTISQLDKQIKGGNLSLNRSKQSCMLVGPSCHGGQTCNELCTVTIPTLDKK